MPYKFPDVWEVKAIDCIGWCSRKSRQRKSRSGDLTLYGTGGEIQRKSRSLSRKSNYIPDKESKTLFINLIYT